MDQGSQWGLEPLSLGGPRPGFNLGLVGAQKNEAEQRVSLAIQESGLFDYFHTELTIIFLSWKKRVDLAGQLNTCHSNCPHTDLSSARLYLLARAAPGQRLSSLAWPQGERLVHQTLLRLLTTEGTLK